ncbi:MAG: ABC transporter permease [Humibacillus sp.]
MNLMRHTAANVRGLWPRYLGLFVLAVLALSAIGASRLLVGTAVASARAGVTEAVALRAISVESNREPGGRVLDEATLATVAALPSVASAEPVYSLPVDVELAATPVGLDLVPVRPSVPPPLVARSRDRVFPLGAGEIVLPAEVDGLDLSPQLGQRVVVGHPRGQGAGSSTSQHTPMVVVALVDPSWQDDGPRSAYAAPDVTRSWFDAASAPEGAERVFAQQGYDKATVLVDRADSVSDVLSRIQGLGLVAVSFQQMAPSLPDAMTVIARLTDIAQWLLIGICVVAVFIVVRSLTAQRTREIGLLKALGHRSGRVTAGLYLESVFVSWAACIASVGVSIVVANLARPLLPAGALPVGTSTIWAVDLPLLFTSLIGAAVVVALGGALPFLRALRMPAAEALRDGR